MFDLNSSKAARTLKFLNSDGAGPPEEMLGSGSGGLTAEEKAYFEKRAQEELELAQKAEHPKAVQAHYEMAELYLDKLHDGSHRP